MAECSPSPELDFHETDAGLNVNTAPSVARHSPRNALAVIVGGPAFAFSIAAMNTLQISSLETALKLYKLDNGGYPSTEQGLTALVTKPGVGVIPKNYKDGGYLEKKQVPKDGWGNDYLYISPGEHGDYDLFSYGADGAKGGDNKNADVTNWDTK